jgi:peptidoglycan glycosyltransferase
MALIAATVARGGTVPQPYLVQEIKTGDYVEKVGGTKGWRDAISPTTAKLLTDIMVNSVDVGWARGARIDGVRVAGKTGTAEIDAGESPHGWFIGFAPADDPVVAVAVVKENSGSGSSEAVPAGKAIMEAALAR